MEIDDSLQHYKPKYIHCHFLFVVCSQRVVDLAHLVASKWPGAGSGKSGDPLEDFCQTNPADEECKVYEA